METVTRVKEPARSSFISVLAWIFIVLAGFGTVISVSQNIMISIMFPVEQMQTMINEAKSKQIMPPIAEFMFKHFRLFFFAIFVVSATTFASAIALFKRKDWARIVFIILMSLGILWNIGGIFFQQILFSSFPKIPAEAQANMPQLDAMFNLMKVITIVMAIGFSILFGWIIKRLASPDIREEF